MDIPLDIRPNWLAGEQGQYEYNNDVIVEVPSDMPVSHNQTGNILEKYSNLICHLNKILQLNELLMQIIRIK